MDLEYSRIPELFALGSLSPKRVPILGHQGLNAMASVILMKTQKIEAAHRLLGLQSVTNLSGYLRAEYEDDLGLATGIWI